MVHTTDKPGLKYNLKESSYSPNYAKAIKYLNRSRYRSHHVPIKARMNIIIVLIIAFISFCVLIASNL
jgi:hypothetical protein